MKMAIVDDEIASVEMLSSIIDELNLNEDIQLTTFTSSGKAMEFLTSNLVDVVFLDIEMPIISGINIANALLETYVDSPEIIFITAYPQYSLEAWRIEAVDYILKPYDPEQIKRALQRVCTYKAGKKSINTRPFIRCFSEFEVFVHDVPVSFASKRAKELLALLVHHRGSWVGISKISYELLEEAPETSAKNYIRMILSRLRKTLNSYGIIDILESRYGENRVDPNRFDCDYYQYLAGEDVTFHGIYMGDYSWAQEEAAFLRNRENL